MSRHEKLLAKLANPAADAAWTFAEAVWLLEHHGFELVGERGSHRVFVSPSHAAPVVLAEHGGKIKSGYIRLIRKTLT